MTQMKLAREGKITSQMEDVAKEEGKSVEYIRSMVAEGKIAICANKNHKNLIGKGIGKGLKTKINTNFGMSCEKDDMNYEMEKLRVSLEMNTDTVMDLSIGGNIEELLTKVVENSPVPVGTVPMYQCVAEHGVEFTTEQLFEVIEKQAKLGVDYMTLHCGINRKLMETMDDSDRYLKAVSRGGGILLAWMKRTGQESPIHEFYDRILDIAAEYDITLSLGDGMRPGCLHDNTDACQVEELINLGKLTKRAWEKNVQVMIEGPGHIPLHMIETNMKIQKTLCYDAPFYVLGPLTTDIGAGHDHITAAIGGAVAAWHGADMLCYVTPAEHLRLPSLLDVKEGIAAAKIAAHSGDLAKGVTTYEEKDNPMTIARRDYDWDKQKSLVFDKEKFEKYNEDGGRESECTMCGEFCPMKNV